MDGASPETLTNQAEPGGDASKPIDSALSVVDAKASLAAELDMRELATMLSENRREMFRMQKEIESEALAQKRSFAMQQSAVDRLLEDFTQRFGPIMDQLEVWLDKQAALSTSIQGQETKLQEIQHDLAPLAESTGLSMQVQSLAADKTLVSEDLISLHGQQAQLTTQQQEISEKICALRSEVQLDGDLTTRFQSEISTLRADVMDVASVVNLLHDRVDELSTGDAVHEAAYELSSWANVTAGLSSRLDWLTAQQAEGVRAPAKVKDAPVIAAIPARVVPLHSPQAQPTVVEPPGRYVASVVQSIGSTQSRSSAGKDLGPISTAPRYRAPSPRKWMTEPLAVTIARGVGEQGTGGRSE